MQLNVETVKQRLEQFGYSVQVTDDAAIDWALQKAKSYACNECSVTEVPDALVYVVVDMAAGEFLQMKKTFAPNDLSGFDLSAAVKQISEGDASVTFATGEGSLTDEQRLSNFISYLLNYGTPQFSCFRRVRW
jgi:CheY-like chemotaxis protein